MSAPTCGANGNSSDAAVASAKRSVSGATESRSREQSLSSSITAAIAVLKANRRRSPLTLSIAQCALRSSSRSAPAGALGTGSSAFGGPASLGGLGRQPPQPAEEAVHPLDALVGPVGVLVGRADEQDVAARGVGADALDDRGGRDDVAPRLAHLGAVLRDHALREQRLERLLEVEVPEVGERLGEEARVHQVQDRVLDAADVLVDGHPLAQRRRVPRGLFVARVAVAQEVPGGVDERVHRVGLALRAGHRTRGSSC